MANMSVHSSFANEVNINQEIMNTLINILGTIINNKRYILFIYLFLAVLCDSSEELVVNTLTAINNLSFHSQDAILQYKQQLIQSNVL